MNTAIEETGTAQVAVEKPKTGKKASTRQKRAHVARYRCIEILREGGFLPSNRFVGLYFCGIPDGLNAQELESYLRKDYAETHGFRCAR